eukprot:CAMPEP_0174358526 /NCGR_PEP_ID=MMETSP0811_2-20130205/43258_1 /TAXON_ID=73025 ORGANISM="Eutreptiella gymnastica-like, Strain CCMP1594" /NCGR_SAMPLE_ID=MMETSP0811_2 /ASSEMBLY_ACC=CAM_ASM_000667 /LENGTH=86 /DNA_ID=CAMNT_0015492389 /DNA_START=338 /DNA_END=599 /DNA_ORIENTATION=-
MTVGSITYHEYRRGNQNIIPELAKIYGAFGIDATSTAEPVAAQENTQNEEGLLWRSKVSQNDTNHAGNDTQVHAHPCWGAELLAGC